MKQSYLNVAFLGCVIISQSFTVANAQCSVSLKAPATTTGHVLKAYPNNDVQSLTWQLNGAAVYTAYNTGFKVKGVTAAGIRTSGSGADQLYAPEDVFTDASGNVYVLDSYNNRVQKWTSGATSGVTVAGGNGFGSAANQLFLPQGFYVDAIGNVYIADLYNHRVQKWASGATEGITVAGGNGYGSAANQLSFPHDVFVDAAGNIYVTDDNNRVQKWAPGATSGVIVAGGNGAGSNANQLNSPFSIFVDDAGNVYISDRANNRVQKWASGATSGVTVAGSLQAGSDSNQLNDPRGIYVDAQGAVYIADYFNNRIQKWMPGAMYGTTVAGTLATGATPFQFFNPSGVYVSASGALFVADEGNNRVQKFPPSTTINKAFIAQQPGTYRVIAVYANGCTATSEEVIINNLQSVQNMDVSQISTIGSNAFIAYPNPVKQSATVQFSSAQREKYTINVTDVTGKIILSNNGISNAGTNIIKLNVSTLASGMYIINLVKSEKEKESIKLIKE